LPILFVKFEGREHRVSFVPGQSLKEILDATGVLVRSGCNGRGACGLCRVQVEAGELGEPSQNERIHLDGSQLAQGVRLACQVLPERDMQILILSLAPKSDWKSLPSRNGRRMKFQPTSPLRDIPQNVKTPYGVAVDLGTTNISISLCDLTGAERLAGRYGVNPQMTFGTDVVTRLVAASESPKLAQTMSQQVVEAIGQALLDISTRREMDLQQVVRLALVGNTAMLALLSGRNYELLLQPRYWMHPIDCLPEETGTWPATWGIHPQATIEFIPPLAGFVGSDLLASVIATRLTEDVGGSLFVDFGTNSEIALWDGQVLWVTSAAGGPAFEGCGLSCGLPAEPGAIYGVNFKDGVPNFDVIADSEPHGLCGSGLVDLISYLVRSGKLSSMGQFAPSIPREGFTLVEDKQGIVLTKGDVDVFQRAKAAIGAGINVLLTQADMGYEDLQRVCVGGAFGHFLNIINAQNIGLLPQIPPNFVELCGNTALAGCEDVLLSSVAYQHLNDLRDKARVINLSQCPDFDALFFENLYLQPVGSD